MPKMTKKELDQRRRERTKANREKPKLRGQRIPRSMMIMDEISNESYLEKHRFNQGRQLVPYDPTPGWMRFNNLSAPSPLLELIMNPDIKRAGI